MCITLYWPRATAEMGVGRHVKQWAGAQGSTQPTYQMFFFLFSCPFILFKSILAERFVMDGNSQCNLLEEREPG